uniref:Uncharacterized protein n=1 Tax=Moniliophthora roreri TaxID=221103 RepID=A0A0W0G4V4_MONRR
MELLKLATDLASLMQYINNLKDAQLVNCNDAQTWSSRDTVTTRYGTSCLCISQNGRWSTRDLATDRADMVTPVEMAETVVSGTRSNVQDSQDGSSERDRQGDDTDDPNGGRGSTGDGSAPTSTVTIAKTSLEPTWTSVSGAGGECGAKVVR